MIAVYYVEGSTPYALCVLEVSSTDPKLFLEEVDKQSYPMPTSEVLFIENDEIVDQFNIP